MMNLLPKNDDVSLKRDDCELRQASQSLPVAAILVDEQFVD